MTEKKNADFTPTQAKEAAETPEAKAKRLEAEIKVLKQTQEKFEEDALKKACDVAGISIQDMLSIKAAQESNEQRMEYDIGKQVVHINGVAFTGRGQGPRSMVEVIIHMASAARQERLKQLVGQQHLVEGGQFGPVKSRVIGTVEEF